jgi:hypothetical protein
MLLFWVASPTKEKRCSCRQDYPVFKGFQLLPLACGDRVYHPQQAQSRQGGQDNLYPLRRQIERHLSELGALRVFIHYFHKLISFNQKC